jgi:pimeloyl-ACP methyl ester carboxylesterase
VLLALSGGPGQPGVPFLARTRSRLGAAANRFDIVAIDQRGTGAGALRCPALQRAMGTSDLTVAPAAAVRDCARRIGPRRSLYTTTQVVADIEALRRALRAQRIWVMGASYGTYVAERYALAYPGHVAKLVLDSVVPQSASGELETQALPRVAQVMRNVCGRCADDLAAVVAGGYDGTALLDTIVAYSVFDPTYRGIPAALRSARKGDDLALFQLIRGIGSAEKSTTASDLSQGLHASALCGDWLWPWGDSSAPTAGREAALQRYAASLPKSALGPFSRSTVTDNGIMRQCLYWPPTPATPQPRPGAKIVAPTLVLAGDRDLSTPLPWPRAELKLLPHGRLVMIHGWGHATQRNRTALAAVRRFLLGS